MFISRYEGCHEANLNGLNRNTERTSEFGVGITWNAWHGHWHSLREVQMAVRVADFRFN